MFLSGIAIQRNFDRLARPLVGRGWQWLVWYPAIVAVSAPQGITAGTNSPNPLALGGLVSVCGIVEEMYAIVWSSWGLVERPALRRNRSPLHRVAASTGIGQASPS
jgi:hypothetical protein